MGGQDKVYRSIWWQNWISYGRPCVDILNYVSLALPGLVNHGPALDGKVWDGNENGDPAGGYTRPSTAGVLALSWSDFVANDADPNQHGTADDEPAEHADGTQV